MKSDFLLAITQLSAEKNLPKDVVITAIEAALVSAYRKDSFAANQNIVAKINPGTGRVEVWAEKTVVEKPSDSRREISRGEARKLKADAQIGDAVMVESTPSNAGRIAAQTARQVILQRLHEAEHSAIFEEYANKEGDVVTGVVQRIEPGQVFVDLGRTEAIMPAPEQVRSERYRPGQRLKVVVLQVLQTPKGARVVVSRSHPDLLRRLFELEVPEVFSGVVEIKGIAREAGFRSKVAVAARQDGIDPVGCCVGLRGIRIQNIVNELNGEKIDVISWSPDAAILTANALSPAHIMNVQLNEKDKVATVVVPDKQLSLAIGKEGQNARLAAKLTGWRIDIKSASSAEAEKLAAAPPAATAEAAPAEVEAAPVTAETSVVPEAALAPAAEGPVAEAVEAPVEPEKELVPPTVVLEKQSAVAKPALRFAEDIMGPRPAKAAAPKTKKKKSYGKESAEDGIRLRKGRRGVETGGEDEDYQQ